MVLEVISQSSVNKDAVILKEAYREAASRNIGSWTRVRIRYVSTSFTIHPKDMFPPETGWLDQIGVFAKAFRLVKQTNVPGHPVFVLEMR